MAMCLPGSRRVLCNEGRISIQLWQQAYISTASLQVETYQLLLICRIEGHLPRKSIVWTRVDVGVLPCREFDACDNITCEWGSTGVFECVLKHM
jgi:hypothetical protein